MINDEITYWDGEEMDNPKNRSVSKDIIINDITTTEIV
jgi:hypothetical protein